MSDNKKETQGGKPGEEAEPNNPFYDYIGGKADQPDDHVHRSSSPSSSSHSHNSPPKPPPEPHRDDAPVERRERSEPPFQKDQTSKEEAYFKTKICPLFEKVTQSLLRVSARKALSAPMLMVKNNFEDFRTSEKLACASHSKTGSAQSHRKNAAMPTGRLSFGNSPMTISLKEETEWREGTSIDIETKTGLEIGTTTGTTLEIERDQGNGETAETGKGTVKEKERENESGSATTVGRGSTGRGITTGTEGMTTTGGTEIQ